MTESRDQLSDRRGCQEPYVSHSYQAHPTLAGLEVCANCGDDREVDRMTLIEHPHQRYGVSELAGTPIVIDTEERERIVARCRRSEDAMTIARALNAQGAVEALAELVRLKDGPRDDAYREAKDAAWAQARDVLSVPQPPRGRSDAALGTDENRKDDA